MSARSVRLTTVDGRQRRFDATFRRFDEGSAIPCFRCGVCCQKWSPLLPRREAEDIAGRLGLSIDEFLDRYADTYPLQEETYILRHTERGCVFLRYEEDGLASCAIHEFKPEACRAYEASLGRPECQEGLSRLGEGALITLDELYADDASRRAFVGRLRPGASS